MPTGYDCILVPVDFSANSDRAVREAVRLLSERGELVLLHVTGKIDPALPWSAANRKVVAKLARQVRSDARAGLDAIAEGLPGVRVRKRVETGVPHQTILETARRERAKAIVIGAQGHTLTDRLLLGSTSERVVRKATLPVLVIPPPRKR